MGEVFHESDELMQLWEFRDHIIKEVYLEVDQFRCRDSGNEVFYVLEIAF